MGRTDDVTLSQTSFATASEKTTTTTTTTGRRTWILFFGAFVDRHLRKRLPGGHVSTWHGFDPKDILD